MGIYVVSPSDYDEYCKTFFPQVLVYDIRAARKIECMTARNFGAVKGQTFERVLIVPTQNADKYLSNGNIAEVESGKEKLYVAITRARYSVAFLSSCVAPIAGVQKWNPDDVSDA